MKAGVQLSEGTKLNVENEEKLHSEQKCTWWWSARELSFITPSFVDMFEDLGFLNVLGLLVPKAASSASLLNLHAFAAVDVWGKWLRTQKHLWGFQNLHLMTLRTQPEHNLTYMQAKDTQIHIGGNLEAKGQRHHGEVECVDAVDLLEGVRVVRPDVGLVGLLGWLVEIVVLLDKFLQLRKSLEIMMDHKMFSVPPSLQVLLTCSSVCLLTLVSSEQSSYRMRCQKKVDFLPETGYQRSYSRRIQTRSEEPEHGRRDKNTPWTSFCWTTS